MLAGRARIGGPGPEFPDRSVWLHSGEAGWREPSVRPGERVTAGQPLGAITSLDGAETLETVTAAAAGVIMFLTSSPAVASDGLLLGPGIAGS
jgi:predicted deacylase